MRWARADFARDEWREGMRHMASRARELQRKAVTTAAGAACLGVVPMLAMTHGHRGLGLVVIAIQVVLVAAAIRYMAAMQRARSSGE